MRFYNEPTTAEKAAFILERDIADRKGQESQMESYKIISTPNGQQYGINGHTPCDHEVMFTYAASGNGRSRKVLFDGSDWFGNRKPI